LPDDGTGSLLLLRHNLIQTPTADHRNQRGYGWASKNNFYSVQDLSPYDSAVYANVFDWIDADRDTAGVRARIGALSASGNPVSCAWTNKKLNMDSSAVDHCFPWSRWFNNDLWNLMLSTSAANNSKADKLSSAALLKDSRHNILNWWESAYLDDNKRSQQFYIEAEATLPLLEPENRSVEEMFHAM
jgi:hypothetical protein